MDPKIGRQVYLGPIKTPFRPLEDLDVELLYMKLQKSKLDASMVKGNVLVIIILIYRMEN